MNMKLGMEVGIGPGHIVLDGDPAPRPPKWHSPFGGWGSSAHVCCGQMAGWIKMPLGRAVSLGPADSVLDGDLASPLAKGHSPQFLAHVCCSKRLDG